MTTTTPKSNDAALAAFMAGKAEIDALLARIAAASDDHFEDISHRIFNLAGKGGGARRDEDKRLRETLVGLGRIGDLISHVRDTQVVAARMVPFVETSTTEWLPRDTCPGFARWAMTSRRSRISPTI